MSCFYKHLPKAAPQFTRKLKTIKNNFPKEYSGVKKGLTRKHHFSDMRKWNSSFLHLTSSQDRYGDVNCQTCQILHSFRTQYVIYSAGFYKNAFVRCNRTINDQTQKWILLSTQLMLHSHFCMEIEEMAPCELFNIKPHCFASQLAVFRLSKCSLFYLKNNLG